MRDKFAAVLDTAALSEAEQGEYCRQRGLYPEQLRTWRAVCEQANDWGREQQRWMREAQQADQKRLRDLDRKLRRKEHALAEAAALLVLTKNARAIWGGGRRGQRISTPIAPKPSR